MARFRLILIASGILFCSFLVPHSLFAADDRGQNLALDMHFGDTGTDFNIGLGIKSPVFLEIINLYLAGDIAWKEAIPVGSTDGKLLWNPYGVIRVGFNIEADALGGVGRLYTGFGGLILLPYQTSITTVDWASWGIFGFDFYIVPDHSWSYFAELGGTLSFVTAEKLSGSPLLQNGFSINTGFRVHF